MLVAIVGATGTGKSALSLDLADAPGRARSGGGDRQRRRHAAVPRHGHRHSQAARHGPSRHPAPPSRCARGHGGRQRRTRTRTVARDDGARHPRPRRCSDPGRRLRPVRVLGAVRLPLPGHRRGGPRAGSKPNWRRKAPRLLHARLAAVDPGRRRVDRAAERPPNRARPRGGRAHRGAVRGRPAGASRAPGCRRRSWDCAHRAPNWWRASTSASRGCGATASSTRCGRSCRWASSTRRPPDRRSGTPRRSRNCAAELEEAEAIALTSALTRRYARRQVGWFRREKLTNWLDDDDPERTARGRATSLVQWLKFPSPRATAPATTSCSSPTPTVTSTSRPRQIAAICDRHFGVGADGVIRAVRSRSLPEGAAALAEDDAAEWFMDYHNADGSPSEMCGNGIRVYANYLLDNGLAELAEGSTLPIGTRGGVRDVQRNLTASRWTSAAGGSTAASRWCAPGTSRWPGRGSASTSATRTSSWRCPATTSSSAADLVRHPGPRARAGRRRNVEFVVPADRMVQDGVGHIRMRVHERGSGETLSCGTGAVAAALAVRHWAGAGAPNRWGSRCPAAPSACGCGRPRTASTCRSRVRRSSSTAGVIARLRRPRSDRAGAPAARGSPCWSQPARR